MTTHKLTSAVYAQGWIESQLEQMVQQTVGKDENSIRLATTFQEMWQTVSMTLDELIQENLILQRKLSGVESALK